MPERFAEIGATLSYGSRRGENIGRGSAGLMIRDTADAKAALFRAGTEGDFAWLAGVLESLAAANPDRLELIRSGIAACEAATKMRKRGPVGGRDAGGRFELTEG